jgi:hypothetical protein
MSDKKPTLLCKDCVHAGIGEQHRKCLHPKMEQITFSYYDGSKQTVHPTVQISRVIGDCGPSGKLWTGDYAEGRSYPHV